MRREFTNAQRMQIVARAMNERGQLCCEGCGLVLGHKRWEIDHTIPEALVVDKSRPLTIEDGQLLGKECCHRGEDGKTAADVAQIAKAKRRERAYRGDKPPSRWPKSKWKRKVNGETVLREQT